MSVDNPHPAVSVRVSADCDRPVSAAPRLLPRCPRKHGGHSRRAPAVPPPPLPVVGDGDDVIPDVDPVEQNRINENVWIRRADLQQRVPLLVVDVEPERAVRRTASLGGSRDCDRLTPLSRPVALAAAADLPVDLSQDTRISRFIDDAAARDDAGLACCEHRRRQHQIRHSVQRGHDRITSNDVPSNSSSVFPLTPAASPTSSVPPTAASFGVDQNQNLSNIMPVALSRWPIALAPSQNSSQPSAELSDENRVRGLDNEYVADPSRTPARNSSSEDIKPAFENDGSLAADGSLPNANEFHLPQSLLTTDDQMLLAYMKMSETLGNKKSSTTSTSAMHSPSSERPVVCRECRGCRCRSCAESARRVSCVIDTVSCVRPVRHLCRSRVEPNEIDCPEDDDRPVTCCGCQRGGQRAGHVALGVLVAALCLPCLCCYWPLKAGHAAISSCHRRYTGRIGVCRCSIDGSEAPTM